MWSACVRYRPEMMVEMSQRPVDAERTNTEVVAANERLALALEATGLLVWDWDIPSGTLQFQPSITDMLGYPCLNGPTHVEGRDLTHPDDVAHFDAAYAAHLNGETPRVDVEFRMKHASGEWRWIHCRGEIVSRDQEGSPLRAVGTFADVTDRHFEAQDRQFLSGLTAALVQNRDAASIINITLQRLAKYLQAERVGISELNDERNAFITRSVWSHPSLPMPPSNHRTAYDAALIEETCNNGVMVIEDVQADPRVVGTQTAELYAKMDIHSLINVRMQARDRNPVFLFIHCRERRKWQSREILLARQIAERLWDSINRARAEVVRDTSDELLQMALSIAKLGAFERDLQSGAVRVSKGFFDLLGHPEIESGTLVDYLSIVHPDDQQPFATKIAQARLGGHDTEVDDEHRILTANGEVRHVVYRSRTHYEKDASGTSRLIRAAAIVQDITEKKKQAEEAAATRDRLHKLSRLTAMGTMASTLAHELNQPLTAAANYLSVLRTLEQSGKSMPDADPGEVLNLAIRKVLDAGKIIKKIRNFTSDGDLHRTLMNVRFVVDRSLSTLADFAGKTEPEVTINIPPKLSVIADEMQMEQVLTNLIRNAAEAMRGRKGSCIQIDASEAEGFVQIRVSDNGPGIPDDFAAELFNPFQSSKRTGLGLGLSLCRTMVEAHGGHLTLEKHDPTGCEFLIRLPEPSKRRRGT